MTINLRPMEFGDVVTVATIEAVISPDPWSRRLFEGEFDVDPDSRHWLAACDEDRVVGYGGVMLAAETAHLMNLGVDPAWSRRRIAQRLCCELFRVARERGAEGLTLEVRSSNRPAIGLYEKFEMTAAGVRPRYYPDGEDAMIYWIHDLHTPDFDRLLQSLADDSPRENP